MSGRFHVSIDQQHQRHGPIVRISPNELSFASASSWKDIYGHATSGKPTFVKSEFYEIYGSGYDTLCIGSERNPKIHGRMRKLLSRSFSSKALKEQEDIVQKCVDEFVEKIGVLGKGERGLDMTEWYEMVSFDILGEMAFGESFHCVEKAEPHFWPALILEHLFFITLVDNLRRYPLLVTLGKFILPRWTVAVRNKHSGFSKQQVEK